MSPTVTGWLKGSPVRPSQRVVLPHVGSGSPLCLKTAIEIGHIFKLGTKYSDAMQAHFLTRDGKPQPLIMGCYGIGVSRIVAAAIEANHDENGIIWPMSIAPLQVLVIALDPRVEQVMQTATQIHDDLVAAGDLLGRGAARE